MCVCVPLWWIMDKYIYSHTHTNTKYRIQVKHVWVSVCPWSPTGSVQATRTLWFQWHVSSWGHSQTQSSVPHVKGSNRGQRKPLDIQPIRQGFLANWKPHSPIHQDLPWVLEGLLVQLGQQAPVKKDIHSTLSSQWNGNRLLCHILILLKLNLFTLFKWCTFSCHFIWWLEMSSNSVSQSIILHCNIL